MTVSSQTSNETFTGNGVTTIWDLPFRFFSNADITAYLIDPVTHVATPLAQGSDYTLTGAGLPEQFGTSPGKITTTVPVDNLTLLYVERVMDVEQLVDIVNQGRFFAEVHEDVFDRLTMLIQQQDNSLSHAIRVPNTDPEPNRLPNASSRALQLMGFDANGNPIAVAPTSGSAAALALDLADPTDPTKGAAKIGRVTEAVDSIKALLTTLTSGNKHISVASYHQGWAATVAGPLGRSVWAWDATEPKANHNGFDKISPTVPWSGAFATMDAFQAGTGETAPGGNGCWLRIHGANDIVSWGCLPAASTNNFAPLSRAIAWAYNNKRKMNLNSGTFEYGTVLDLSYPTLVLRGDGFRNTVLKFTGTGEAATALGTRPNNGAYSYGLTLSDFTLEGSAAATNLLRTRINQVDFSNLNFREASTINGCCLVIEGTVSGRFNNILASTNAQLMSSRPLVGIRLLADPTDGRRASNNTFINVIIEGMTSDGILIQACDHTTFIGGTSENNPGNGVTISAGCQLNTLIGMGFENSGFADVFDGGIQTRAIGCYTRKNYYFDNSSQFCSLEGGYHEKIETGAGASFPKVSGVKVKFFGGTGGIVTNGNQSLSTMDVFDVALGGLVFTKKAFVTVTVTTGTFTYTNNTGGVVMAVLTGGTISTNTYGRGGPAIALPTSGMFAVLPGDSLIIANTVAPALTIIPHGDNFI